MKRKKTISMLVVNKDGFAIGDFKDLSDAEPMKTKTGAWIAHMYYENDGSGWVQSEMVMMAATAVLYPRTTWELADHDIFSESRKIAIWDWQAAQRLKKDEEYRANWEEQTEKILGNRDFAEFDNFLLFQDKDPGDTDYDLYSLYLCKNTHGDIMGIKILLKPEEVSS